MIHSDRIRLRMEKVGLTQAALAQRVEVTQGAIAKIANKNPNGSSHLHKIARVLETTPAYLTGEIDDPDEGALPPQPKPTVQIATMQVLLPDARALERMFLGILKASEGLSQEALARELAQMLPKGLGLLRGPLVFEGWDDDDAQSDESANDHDDRPARRRA